MPVRVKLCAIAKNEGAYVADWVFHHLHFGFDAVEVWVNGTEDPSLRILKRISAARPEVTGRRADRLLERCVASGEHFQRRAYTKMARKARAEGFTHVAFLDLDEYWLPRDCVSPIRRFVPEDPEVKVVSFLWCFDLPGPDLFGSPLSAPVRLQVERVVKSVTRLDDSVRSFREHTAGTRGGRRLLAREAFPEVERGAPGGKSMVPAGFLADRWGQLPEAFVLHAVNRSPREFVSTLTRGMRQTGQPAELKPNRWSDLPTAAPVLDLRVPSLVRWRYERRRRAFHREVGVQRMIETSRRLMDARASSLLEHAESDAGLAAQLSAAVQGIPADVLDDLRTGPLRTPSTRG